MLRRVGVAISAGRRAYLLKERIHNREELIEAIQAVAHGGPVIDPIIVDVLIKTRLRAAHSPLSELTARERKVLAEIATSREQWRGRRRPGLDPARGREARELDLLKAPLV